MITRTIVVLLVGACIVTLSSGQRQNYPSEEQYYEEPAPVPQRAAPRQSYSRPSALQDSAPKPTPVPILKQINKHNEDGSYTYGYEGADGSFKIETKLPTGEVMGKYGYVDDVGKVRVVEYGANRYGFMPAGEGITVAPPTLVDETTDKNGNKIVEDYDEPQQSRPAQRPKSSPNAVHRPAPIPVLYEQDYNEEQYEQPAPQPQRPVFAPVPVRAKPAVPSFDSFEQHFRNSAPAPAPPRPAFAAPVAGSQPAPANFGPAPPRRPQVPGAIPAPVYEEHQAPPRPAPARLPVPQRSQAGRSHGGSGLLDQLAKDYALPAGGAGANVDISFSSY